MLEYVEDGATTMKLLSLLWKNLRKVTEKPIRLKKSMQRLISCEHYFF